MRNSKNRIMRRFLRREQGQTLVLTAVMGFTLMALSAAGIESGHVYYAYRLLQASTNAAALAAGQDMPNIGTSGSTIQGTAFYDVTEYSSESGKLNATNMLQNAAISASFTCSSTLASAPFNVACQSPTSGTCSSGLTCNQIVVTQTAKAPLWFGGFLGVPTMNLAASATASMRGGTNIPYNIAVIIDTTGSMASCNATQGGGGNPCTSDCPNGATSEVDCAVQGLKIMLQNMDPCALNTTCASGSGYVDSVSLFVFPAIEVTSSKNYTVNDTTCPTSNPPTVPYSFEDWTGTGSTSDLFLPTPTGVGSTYIPTNAGTYQVTNWDNTYKTNDLTTTLNASDSLGLPIAVGAESCSKGLQAPGGEGTYYAQAIYEAQAALAAEQTKYPGSQNVLIILSDGDATACNTQVATGSTTGTVFQNTCGGGGGGNSEILADNCPSIASYTNPSTKVVTYPTSAAPCPNPAYAGLPINGTAYSYTNAGKTVYVLPTGYNSAAYPSALGMCGQAVQAAQDATSAGTAVYTVAMGAETTGSCTSDAEYSLGPYTGASTWPGAGGQACAAIGAMASNANTFYSDGINGCKATNTKAFTTMAQIFDAISGNLTVARLVPPGV